jgi:hypothetical protein
VALVNRLVPENAYKMPLSVTKQLANGVKTSMEHQKL